MKQTSILALILLLCSCLNSDNQYPKPYLGEELPGDTPRLFAPGIVNDGITTRDITFLPDGSEIYFCKATGNSAYSVIIYCKKTETGWTSPEVVDFAKDPNYIYIEPFISPDGKKMFFVTNKGNEFSENNRFITDIWVTNRLNGEWSEPCKLDSIINSPDSEFFPSVAANGNLYFTRENTEKGEGFIYKSEYKNGRYQEPEKLPVQINAGAARFNSVISSDESFMIIPVYGMSDSRGGTDYYISFYDKIKGWSEPLNLGDRINTESGNEYSANFSPDGKFFFFMSSRIGSHVKADMTFQKIKEIHNSPESGNSNIYWMKSDFVLKLKEKATFVSGNKPSFENN